MGLLSGVRGFCGVHGVHGGEPLKSFKRVLASPMIVPFYCLLFFVVGGLIWGQVVDKPVHERIMQQQQQCQDKGGLLVRGADGKNTCVSGIKKVD